MTALLLPSISLKNAQCFCAQCRKPVIHTWTVKTGESGVLDWPWRYGTLARKHANKRKLNTQNECDAPTEANILSALPELSRRFSLGVMACGFLSPLKAQHCPR